MFETTILPVVVTFARMCFRGDPDLIADAVTQAWFAWHTARNPNLPPSVWARAGVRRVRTKRDLPGLGTGAKDALHRCGQGGDMDGLPDRLLVEPLATLIHREDLERIRSEGGTVRRQVIAMLVLGMGTTEVAEATGLSLGRISQIRREAMEG